jgi:hypothetical protein
MKGFNMAASDSILETTDLHALFEYRDGDLFWKADGFKESGILHSRRKGKLAGTLDQKGYRSVKIKNVSVKCHRVVFKMFNGYLPKIIDHIDGNRSNNRIENLREATPSQNVWNSKTQSNSKSGVKGVCWHKQKKKWMASCAVNRRIFYLGYFDDINDAVKVLESFRKINHKDFACQG